MSRISRPPTYYDILGVPTGASTDHIRDSYRLLTNKTQITDFAYENLTDPEKRQKYDHWLRVGCKLQTQPQVEHTHEEQRWGKRGRERCSCGKVLNIDDEWLCQECWERLEYFVVFNLFGAFIIHESQMLDATQTDNPEGSEISSATCFGPFTQEEAEAFLVKSNEMRGKSGRRVGDPATEG